MNSFLFKIDTRDGEQIDVLVVNAIDMTEAVGHVQEHVRRGDEAVKIELQQIVSELKTFRVSAVGRRV